MEGKIFSYDKSFAFDLQRFDDGWSLQSGQTDKWSYSTDGSTVIASIEGSNKKLTLSMVETASGNPTISLTSDAGASMLGGNTYNFLDAGTSSLPVYFEYNDNKIKTVIGGSDADSLIAGNAGVYLFGGNGADSLFGGNGNDIFVYDGQGSDSIGNYGSGDVVSLGSSIAFPGVDSVKADGSNHLVFDFGNNKTLTFADNNSGNSIFTAVNGNDTFYYTKDYIMNGGKTAVSLTPAATNFPATSGVISIDGSAANSGDGLTINGNEKNNYIIGSASKANTIYGGAGKDIISLNGGNYLNVYVYSGGADSVKGLGTGGGYISLGSSNLSFVTSGSNLESLTNAAGFKLTFSSGNTLTFDGSSLVSLKSGTNTYAYTPTAISVKGANGNGDSITLGGSYDGTTFDGSSFKLVNASAVTKNAISIKGGNNGSYLISGSKGGSLIGGTGNDTLEGGSGIDYFFYDGKGSDSIKNYTYSTVDTDSNDIVSLTSADLTLPTSLGSNGAQFANSNFVVSLGADSVLTFLGNPEIEIRSANGKDTYHYTKDRIIVNNERITLGSEYSQRTFTAGDKITSIDASALSVTGGLNIVGNTDLDNSIISAKNGGTITGGEKDDYLAAASQITNNDTLILNGGAEGNDTLVGGNSKDIFVYYGGADSIKNYNTGDLVSVVSSKDGVNFTELSISSVQTGNNLVFNFDGEALSIAGGTSTTVSLQSGKSNSYIYKGATFTHNQKSITLTADYNYGVFGSDSLTVYGASITAIDASRVKTPTNGISIVGNNYGNVLIGAATISNSLTGGTGNDIFTGGTASDLFYYNGGKDVITEFVGGSVSSDNNLSDIISIAPKSITSARATSKRMVFTVDKDNAVTLNGDDIELVSLQGDGYLTKNGYVSLGASESAMTLFSSAKGRIDLKEDDLYKGASIKAVDAFNVKKQSVTLVGSSLGGTFSFAEGNGKRDIFEYNGGKVSISGYESGKDRLSLGEGAISAFSISGSGTNSNLLISVSGFTENLADNVISIAGGNSKELLIRQDNSNFYKKMVLNETGVFLNKLKRPTEATVTAAVDGGFTADNNNKNTIKKIYVAEGVSGVSIQAGGKVKTLIDASAASGVSLYGGNKNDKLIGSSDTTKADTFVYTGGKDVIQNFVSGSDSISFADNVATISTAKISANSKAASFKFNTKNTLSIKPPNKASITSITFNGKDYQFGKNWYGELAEDATSPEAVSLTSQFSGNFKTDDKAFGKDNPTLVSGALVTKNLKFKGTSEAESLIGANGSTKAKTNFRGGGGEDSLVGGIGKDTFFYVKNTTGNTEIQNFDLTNDKIRIASGAISEISTVDGGIEFEMNRKDNDATFKITSFADNNNKTIETPQKYLIHANNTYYWFAEGPEDMVDTVQSGDEVITLTSASPGELVTTTDKISKSVAQQAATSQDYAIIELGYATNLVNSGVAKKFSDYEFTSSGPEKKTD